MNIISEGTSPETSPERPKRHRELSKRHPVTPVTWFTWGEHSPVRQHLREAWTRADINADRMLSP